MYLTQLFKGSLEGPTYICPRIGFSFLSCLNFPSTPSTLPHLSSLESLPKIILLHISLISGSGIREIQIKTELLLHVEKSFRKLRLKRLTTQNCIAIKRRSKSLNSVQPDSADHVLNHHIAFQGERKSALISFNIFISYI